MPSATVNIDQTKVIDLTKKHIKKQMEGEHTGHDWWHVYRVYNTAEKIAEKEDADLFIVRLGALLHDIADHKFHNGDENIGPKKAKEWLEQLNVDDEVTKQVTEIVKNVSFKGANVNTDMPTIEGKVVQDADRLDALGAIGIARTFAYGGSKSREIYNPNIDPEMHENFENYKSSKAPTINHFYEKLLLLKDRMQTKTGKEMAEQRHQFMETYLAQFYAEWKGIA